MNNQGAQGFYKGIIEDVIRKMKPELLQSGYNADEILGKLERMWVRKLENSGATGNRPFPTMDNSFPLMGSYQNQVQENLLALQMNMNLPGGGPIFPNTSPNNLAMAQLQTQYWTQFSPVPIPVPGQAASQNPPPQFVMHDITPFMPTQPAIDLQLLAMAQTSQALQAQTFTQNLQAFQQQGLANFQPVPSSEPMPMQDLPPTNMELLPTLMQQVPVHPVAQQPPAGPPPGFTRRPPAPAKETIEIVDTPMIPMETEPIMNDIQPIPDIPIPTSVLEPPGNNHPLPSNVVEEKPSEPPTPPAIQKPPTPSTKKTTPAPKKPTSTLTKKKVPKGSKFSALEEMNRKFASQKQPVPAHPTGPTNVATGPVERKTLLPNPGSVKLEKAYAPLRKFVKIEPTPPPPPPEPEPEPEPDDDLLSSDSQEEEDAALFQCDNTVICTFTSVKRVKNKYKFQFKNGIMHVGGKDYAFSQMNGEGEW